MKFIFKLPLIIYTVFISLLFLTGCEDKKVIPKDMKKLNLAIGMQPSSALTIIAMEKGFFKDNGLDVKVSSYPSGKRALNDSLLLGKSDIAIAADVPTVIAFLKNKPISVLATSFSADNVNRVIARKNSEIYSPHGLKGKKIATQKGSAVHFYLDLFIIKNGINYNEVDISFMKAEKLPEAIASKSIDAFSMREPFISQAIEKLKGEHIIFAEPGLYRQVEAISVNNNFLKHNPQAIKRFLKSLIMAENFANKSQQESIELVAKKLEVSVDSIEKIWPQVKFNISLQKGTIDTFNNIAKWAISNQLVDLEDIPDIEQHFNLESLKSLKPKSVEMIN